MRLFSKKEVNVSRQFEFDFAKAICIFGMVFVHCFEEIPLTASGYNGSLYYTFVIVLDAIFGAGTFMICLGIGLTYTNKNKPNDFIRRGIITLAFGYLLNVFRFVLPYSYYLFGGDTVAALRYLLSCFLYTDIMQFAGLAFLLFGLLKKIKVPDWGIAVIAVIMSVVGSFVRFINLESIISSELLGLFVGTIHEGAEYTYFAPFAIINWFILVVFGYFYGKLFRRVENVEKFFAISTIVSAVIVITYMIIAIPNRIGMMCGDETYYFQMTTWEVIIIMMGAVLMFGIYHYISKLFSIKVKNFITNLSTNINKTYCIHWVIVGFLGAILWILFEDGLDISIVVIIAIFVYIISSLLAELIRRNKDKKKALKYAANNKD